MAKTTIVIKDKNFRIVIPEAVRIAENLQVGDVVEIEVKKLGKPATKGLS
jgi:bifunctional DNA-binding transcriptional regulator/antitoxin component of YhaV-PrlF toxin-antitoxin module